MKTWNIYMYRKFPFFSPNTQTGVWNILCKKASNAASVEKALFRTRHLRIMKNLVTLGRDASEVPITDLYGHM